MFVVAGGAPPNTHKIILFNGLEPSSGRNL